MSSFVKLPPNKFCEDCAKLTAPQWKLLLALYHSSSRRECLVNLVLGKDYQYKTLKVLAQHRLVKLRCLNTTASRYEYVQLTRFGYDLAKMYRASIKTDESIDTVSLAKRHELCAQLFEAGMSFNRDWCDLLFKELYQIDKKLPVPVFDLPTDVPKVGDYVYLPTRVSIDHGNDDVQGGVGVVRAVTESRNGGGPDFFVETHEQPGRGHSWRFLKQEQESLKRYYGTRWANPDPDLG
jgi:hypothetical protein